MADRLSEFPGGQFPHKVYPWHWWADGSPWRLHRGQDFKVSVASMKSAASSEAARRGVRCRVRVEDENTVVIQFIPR